MARDRLGDILLRAGLLDREGLQRALNEQRRWGGLLGHYLVELGLVSEENLVRALSTQYKMPAVSLDPPKLDVQVARLVPQRICERHRLICFRADSKSRFLDVALANPANSDALEEVRVATRYNVRPHIAGPRVIDQAITFVFYGELPIGSAVDLAPASSLRQDRPVVPEQRRAPTVELDVQVSARQPSAAPRDRLTREMSWPTLPGAGDVALPPTDQDSGLHVTVGVPSSAAAAGAAGAASTTVEERVAHLEAVIVRDGKIIESLLDVLVRKGLLTRQEVTQIITGR